MPLATDVARASDPNWLHGRLDGRRPQSDNSSFPPWSDATERGRRAGLLLLLACLCFFLFGASRGWKHNLSDRHGFRQTQTAISAYYMLQGPWTLAYETPVVGPPWSIPFEFPLYQWTVAATARVSHLPLNQAGRLVSIVFFLLTLWPLASILRLMKLTVAHRLLIGALVVASPFYVFWSRTFMIESTALFLALSYLAFVLAYAGGRKLWPVLAATAIGALAAAVKITTFLPFAVAVQAVLLVGLWRDYRSGKSWRGLLGYCGAGLLMVATPAIALLLWTHFADAHKAANLIGQHMTSKALNTWNFGTLDQRLSWQTWRTILDHERLVLGSNYFVGVMALGLVFGRRRLQIVACLLLFVIAPLAFTNLYSVHDYYTYGSAILLLTAVGISLVSLLERGPWHAGAAACLVCLMVGTFAHRYMSEYYPAQANQYQNWDGIASQVERVTAANETLLVLGYDWSSELPYYCHRRAVMVPGWVPEIQNTASLLSVAMNLNVRHIVVHAAGQYNGFDAHELEALARARGLGVERAYADQELTIYRLVPERGT